MMNPYTEDIDFAQLAIQDSDFAKVLKPNGQLDFSNPDSVQQLTKSLLMRDFGLKIDLPPDRLCPPVRVVSLCLIEGYQEFARLSDIIKQVPNRLNYLLWIQSLLDTTSESCSDIFVPQREVLGLDIGTGASSIYPLLGSSRYPKWRFAGTDIDEKSFQFARRNIQANGLQSRVKLLKTQPDGPLLPLDTLGFDRNATRPPSMNFVLTLPLRIDFSMCNPPFYESTADMLNSAATKQRPPFTACTGSESEMVTPGGEVAFVSKMIEESLTLQDRVQWYTSMLGKFSSVGVLVTSLRSKGVDNYAVTEFVQGTKTRRWGIAWSFEDWRPRMNVARGVSSVPKALLPFPSEYIIALGGTLDVSTTSQHLNQTLSELPVKWMWKPSISIGVGFAEKAVWSRAARRQVAKDQIEADEDADMALGFKIYVEGINGETGVQVIVRWLRGNDSVLFESFCGMVKRKLEQAKGNDEAFQRSQT